MAPSLAPPLLLVLFAVAAAGDFHSLRPLFELSEEMGAEIQVSTNRCVR